MKVRKFLQGLVGLLVLLGLCHSASAQKAIRQTKTLPIVISKPGSYILKSNITVPDANTTAILVQADNVTINLNGFSILGPCTGGPPCSPTGSGNGIDSRTSFNLNTSVLNGTVQGMGAEGISVVNGRLQGVTAVSNGGDGIVMLNPGTVVGCEADDNGQDGILTNSGIVTNSVALENRRYGISGRQLIANFSVGNTVNGLMLLSDGGYSNNVMFANPGGNVAGGTNMGHNLCNGSLCP